MYATVAITFAIPSAHYSNLGSSYRTVPLQEQSVKNAVRCNSPAVPMLIELTATELPSTLIDDSATDYAKEKVTAERFSIYQQSLRSVAQVASTRILPRDLPTRLSRPTVSL